MQGDIDYVNKTDSSDLAYVNSAGVRCSPLCMPRPCACAYLHLSFESS